MPNDMKDWNRRLPFPTKRL